jgi:uroporphyrinogen-III synthase
MVKDTNKSVKKTAKATVNKEKPVSKVVRNQSEKTTEKAIKTVSKTSKVEISTDKNTIEKAKKVKIETAAKTNKKSSLPRHIKNILISQPEPTGEKSPYTELSKKYKLKFTYIPFLKVESLTLREFRKNKINIADYTAIIFNSKNAIDYFFKICEEMRHKMPQEAKYICSSEAIAYYLQKYIQYRKRKVIYSNGTPQDMQNILKKYQATDNFLLPCSALGIGFLPAFLKQNKFNFTEAIMYRMVPNDDLKSKTLNYDLITFFNPEGVKAFMTIYPEFIDQRIAIGAFGEATQLELKKNGITVHAKAPIDEIKSMVMAIEKLFKDNPDLAEEL